MQDRSHFLFPLSLTDDFSCQAWLPLFIEAQKFASSSVKNFSPTNAQVNLQLPQSCNLLLMSMHHAPLLVETRGSASSASHLVFL